MSKRKIIFVLNNNFRLLGGRHNFEFWADMVQFWNRGKAIILKWECLGKQQRPQVSLSLKASDKLWFESKWLHILVDKALDCNKPPLAFHLSFSLFCLAVSNSWGTGSGCCYCLSYLAGMCRTFIFSCQNGVLVRFITCIKQRVFV